MKDVNSAVMACRPGAARRAAGRDADLPLPAIAAVLGLAAAMLLPVALRAADVPAGAGGLSAEQQRGQKVFDAKCLPCHGPGVWGTNALGRRMDKSKAELEKRTDLNAQAVKVIMRTGIGSMPPIRKTEVPDADADAIAAYLTRNSKP